MTRPVQAAEQTIPTAVALVPTSQSINNIKVRLSKMKRHSTYTWCKDKTRTYVIQYSNINVNLSTYAYKLHTVL